MHRFEVWEVSIAVLALISAVAALYVASTVFIPVMFSFFMFFLLEPMVLWFERKKKVSRKFAAPVLVLIAMIAAFSIGWGAYVASIQLVQDVPRYSGKIKTVIHAFQGKAQVLHDGTQSLLPKAAPSNEVQKVEIVENMGGAWTQAFMSGIDSIFGIIAGVFFVPILALFLLLEKIYLKSSLRRIAGDSMRLNEIGEELIQMVRGFFVGNCLLGLGMSAVFYIFFRLIKLENALPLAVVAGFVNLVPLLGAFLGVVFPMAAAILQFDTMAQALLILTASIIIHFIVANLVMPKVIGSKINVNATAATIGLIFWGWLWGGVGLLLAIPLTAVIRIVLKSSPDMSGWSDLLAENPSGSVSRLFLQKTMTAKIN